MVYIVFSISNEVGMPEPTPAEVKEVLKSLDKNEDGKISKDELKVLVKEIFQMLIKQLESD